MGLKLFVEIFLVDDRLTIKEPPGESVVLTFNPFCFLLSRNQVETGGIEGAILRSGAPLALLFGSRLYR